MGERASLIATLAEPPDDGVLAALPRSVDWLELRADLCGEVPAAWLRERFPADFSTPCAAAARAARSRARSRGGANGSPRRRRTSTGSTSKPSAISTMRCCRRCRPRSACVSWHGPGREASQLERQFQTMAQVPAALYKLVPLARESSEEVAALELLVDLGRRDVLCFAAGESGVWTRYIAPYLGAPILLGAASAKAGAPGQPTVAKITRDYPFPELPAVDTLYGIVGNPVAHSLSPRLHNGAYRALGIAALFVPFGPSSFADFWLEVVEGNVLGAFAPLGGLSITAPYKSAAAAVAGAMSPLAQSIDSANTLVLREGVWEGETTDPQGVIGALAAAGIEPRGRRAAVVGCGGAGRAAAAGLKQRGRRDGAGQSDGGEGSRRRRRALAPVRAARRVRSGAVGHRRQRHLARPRRGRPARRSIRSVWRRARRWSTWSTASGRPRCSIACASSAAIGVDGREVLLHQAHAISSG